MDEALSHTQSAAPAYGLPSGSAPGPASARAPLSQRFRAWLPALMVLIGMPVLALAATKYVLLPSVKNALSPAAYAAGQGDTQGEAVNVIMAKVPLNDPAALGKHSEFRSVTLIGATPEFKVAVSENRIKLATMAAGTLSGMTLSDLEKPGRLDSVRAELASNLNKVLGTGAVKEVYITVWPRKG